MKLKLPATQSEKLDARLEVRISASQRRILIALAAAEGIRPSDVIRAAIAERAARIRL